MTSEPAVPALRILVVDDDLAVGEATRLLLETLGHRVWLVSSGHHALETVSRVAPALVFLDLEMPEMDGFETARRLRQSQNHELVLIAYSGLGDSAARARAEAAGFDHFLAKPATARAIRTLLDRNTRQ